MAVLQRGRRQDDDSLASRASAGRRYSTEGFAGAHALFKPGERAEFSPGLPSGSASSTDVDELRQMPHSCLPLDSGTHRLAALHDGGNKCGKRSEWGRRLDAQLQAIDGATEMQLLLNTWDKDGVATAASNFQTPTAAATFHSRDPADLWADHRRSLRGDALCSLADDAAAAAADGGSPAEAVAEQQPAYAPMWEDPSERDAPARNAHRADAAATTSGERRRKQPTASQGLSKDEQRRQRRRLTNKASAIRVRARQQAAMEAMTGELAEAREQLQEQQRRLAEAEEQAKRLEVQLRVSEETCAERAARNAQLLTDLRAMHASLAAAPMSPSISFQAPSPTAGTQPLTTAAAAAVAACCSFGNEPPPLKTMQSSPIDPAAMTGNGRTGNDGRGFVSHMPPLASKTGAKKAAFISPFADGGCHSGSSHSSPQMTAATASPMASPRNLSQNPNRPARSDGGAIASPKPPPSLRTPFLRPLRVKAELTPSPPQPAPEFTDVRMMDAATWDAHLQSSATLPPPLHMTPTSLPPTHMAPSSLPPLHASQPPLLVTPPSLLPLHASQPPPPLTRAWTAPDPQQLTLDGGWRWDAPPPSPQTCLQQQPPAAGGVWPASPLRRPSHDQQHGALRRTSVSRRLSEPLPTLSMDSLDWQQLNALLAAAPCDVRGSGGGEPSSIWPVDF